MGTRLVCMFLLVREVLKCLVNRENLFLIRKVLIILGILVHFHFQKGFGRATHPGQ